MNLLLDRLTAASESFELQNAQTPIGHVETQETESHCDLDESAEGSESIEGSGSSDEGFSQHSSTRVSAPDPAGISKPQKSHDSYWAKRESCVARSFPSSGFTDILVSNIQDDLKRSACRCSDAGLPQCTAQFTVGAVLDIRLSRKALGYSAEKIVRQQELKEAIQRRDAANSDKLQFLIQGKFVCLHGYVTICCVPKASGLLRSDSYCFI